MQKLRRINKEKNFLEWTRKRRNHEDQLAAQPDLFAVPLVWACVQLLQPEQGNTPSLPYQPR